MNVFDLFSFIAIALMGGWLVYVTRRPPQVVIQELPGQREEDTAQAAPYSPEPDPVDADTALPLETDVQPYALDLSEMITMMEQHIRLYGGECKTEEELFRLRQFAPHLDLRIWERLADGRIIVYVHTPELTRMRKAAKLQNVVKTVRRRKRSTI